jgi:hypothetical protein
VNPSQTQTQTQTQAPQMSLKEAWPPLCRRETVSARIVPVLASPIGQHVALKILREFLSNSCPVRVKTLCWCIAHRRVRRDSSLGDDARSATPVKDGRRGAHHVRCKSCAPPFT